MTSRQFLVRWPVLLALGLIAGTVVALLATNRTRFASTSASLASTSNDAQGASPNALRVVASPIGDAGPEYLLQHFTGVVVARRTSRLAAKAIGRVEHVAVDIGDAVQAGQLLIQLDHDGLDATRDVAEASLESANSRLSELQRGPRQRDIDQAQARVSELQANLRLSQANADRTQSLRASSAISQQEYDESRFRLQATTAQLASAENALELLREGTRSEQIVSQSAVVAGLRAQLARIDVQLAEQRVQAPYAGQIRSRQTDEGDIVSPGQTLLEIVETSKLEVHVGLPTQIARELEPSNFRIVIDDRQLAADLDRMAPVVDETTRTRKCVFLLRKSTASMVVVGDAVKLEIRRPVQDQGIWIPTTALTAGARGLWTLLIAEPTGQNDSPASGTHVISQRPVELLRAQGAWSEVRGPIDAGDLLVTEGVHRVVAGQIVDLASDQQ